VARLAGISKSAVARVLSGQGYASAELRGVVLAAAEALGYSPNAVGKAFRQQRTGTIGLIVPDITNPFYAFVADGVLQVAREQDYRVVLVASDEGDAAELRCLMLLVESRVDGIIAVPAGGNAAAWSKAIRLGRKVVLVDREVPGIEGVPLVCVDNRGGVRKAIDHLLSLGHRDIGLLTGPLAISTARERLAGFLDAHAEAGLPVSPELIVETSYTRQNASEAALRLLGRDRSPTAVLAGNNILGEAVIGAARRLGRAIPRDLSVLVFDDPPWTSLLDPPITVVQQPMRELGATAARHLIAQLRGAEPPCPLAVLSTQLIVRGSTGAPR
jgi:LacI family transcriptional regulator